MVRESISSPYAKLIFREPFRDEQSVRRNGGTPTNVTFSNGVGGFNGTPSKINYNLGLNGTYSVRIRCNPTSFDTNQYLFDVRGSDAKGVGRFFIFANTGLVNTSSGTVYVNGIVTKSTIFSNNNEIVIAGIDLIEGSGLNRSLIGLNQSNGDGLLGTIDLVEIYQGTLTASEVANLSNNKWNKEVSGYGGQIGSNVITNGTFDSDTDWNTGAGWTISDGKLKANDSSTSASNVGGGPYVIGKQYKIIINVSSYTSGALYTSSANFNGSLVNFNLSGAGKYIKELPAVNTNQFAITCSRLTCEIDNITVQELNPKTLLDFDSTNGVLEDKTVGNPVGNNLITNGDFSSYSDGLGTGWTTISQTFGRILSESIVTGNGFSTNAQRVEMTVDNGSSYFRIDNTGGTKPTIGKKYRIYFKYRSNKSIQVRFGLGYGVLIIPDNTGDAIVYTNIITATTADVSLYIYSPGVGSYFEFSEISLFEIRPDLSATDVSIKKIGQNYSADFNGSSSVITAGNLGTINTLNFVLYYDGSNQNGIIDLNGTNGVSHSGGTLSYFGTNAYINGVDTDTLSMGWNFITVIDTAGKNASAFRMGYNGANYFKGRLAKCQAYSGLLDLATHTQWWTEQFKDFR